MKIGSCCPLRGLGIRLLFLRLKLMGGAVGSRKCRVWGLGFRVWGLGFGVWGLGFKVKPGLGGRKLWGLELSSA